LSPEQLLGSVEFNDDVVVADFEAGVGTLTRLSEQRVDTVLVVVEPTPKSVEVGMRAVALAQERSVTRVIVVANRLRDDADLAVLRSAFPGCDVVAVPDDPKIVEADRKGVAPIDLAPDAPAVLALVGLAERLAG
jgi:CO dehydrogenase maturation factor